MLVRPALDAPAFAWLTSQLDKAQPAPVRQQAAGILAQAALTDAQLVTLAETQIADGRHLRPASPRHGVRPQHERGGGRRAREGAGAVHRQARRAVGARPRGAPREVPRARADQRRTADARAAAAAERAAEAAGVDRRGSRRRRHRRRAPIVLRQGDVRHLSRGGLAGRGVRARPQQHRRDPSRATTSSRRSSTRARASRASTRRGACARRPARTPA